MRHTRTIKRLLHLAIGLLLWSVISSAQTTGGAITGTIRNAEGVLEGASVFLVKDRETQEIVQFAVSDAAGGFTMNAPAGNYIFGVSYLGYAMHTEEISLTAEPLDLGTITLETSAEELQTVVVRGQIVGVRTQPDGFTVDVREIRERSNDALDLLKHIPKVQVKGNQLGILGKEQVLVKIGNVLQRVDASEIAGLLKGYDAGLIDRVEVITQPPLRYDPDGNTAMIILHTSSLFKEYMGGVIGTEGMFVSKDNFRYGGYGSLLYNRRGLFASIAPSINFNGSNNLEDVTYEAKDYRYRTYTPSVGRYDYMGVRGTLQYAYGEKSLLGVALSWNRKKYRNLFESQETTTQPGTPERVVENSNGYLATEPRITATAYWEATFGERGGQLWSELSYFNLTNDSQTTYVGQELPQSDPFLAYSEERDLRTSGAHLSSDYAIYLDSDNRYLLETGLKGAWSSSANHRAHNDAVSPYPLIQQSNDIIWQEWSLSPYVSGTLRLSEQWWMRLGVRYLGVKSHLAQQGQVTTTIPDLDRYDDAWLPMLHTSYTPSSRHQLTLTVNSSIVEPKFRDLNPFVWQVNERTFYQGNAQLRPELRYLLGVGYTFDQALSIRGRLRRGLRLMTPISTLQGERVYTQMENAQNSLFLGAEVGYYFDKLRWMSANLEAYYGRSIYTSTLPQLPPKMTGSEWGVSGYLDFTFNESHTWTGFLSGEYTGRQKTTVVTLEPQYNVGLGMSYFLLDRRLALSIAGLNLLVSNYKGVSQYDGYNVTFDNRYDVPTLYISISYKFSNGKDTSSTRSQGARDIERRF